MGTTVNLSDAAVAAQRRWALAQMLQLREDVRAWEQYAGSLRDDLRGARAAVSSALDALAVGDVRAAEADLLALLDVLP